MSTPASTAGRTVGGRYILRSPVGAGGMGTVWRAHDEVLQRDVAVKEILLPPGIPTEERTLLCERTMREARAAAKLAAASVVTVYDVVEEDDRPWIVMELLEARSLAEVIRDDGPMPPERTAEIGLQVLGALEAAHRIGILHRDVKPANVLVDRPGRATLTDFGVARAPGDSALTSTGLLVGSPSYISPERARGLPPGPPSDLWSLGATLYAAVEGRPPFDRGDPVSTLTAVVSEPPRAFARAGALVPVLRGLLEKDPATRWNAPRARSGLRAVLTTRGPAPPKTAPPRPAAARSPGAIPAPAASPEPPTAAVPTPAPASGPEPPSVGQPASHPTVVVAGETTQSLARALPEREEPATRHTRVVHRRHRTVALMAIFLAIVAVTAAAAFVLTKVTVGDSARTAAPIDARRVDTGYTRYVDAPHGFSVLVPAGWRKHVAQGYVQLDDPRGGRFVRLETEAVRTTSMGAYWRAADRYAHTRLVGYHLVGIGSATVAGRPGANWEFTHARTGPRHVIARGLVVGGRMYSFYFSTRRDQFAASRAILDTVANSFRLAA